LKNKNKKVLVAVAWPYVNGDIHVGHLSGYLLPADVFARFNRLLGNDVLMVSGSDTHGTPITVEADKSGVSPQMIVDKYHQKTLDLFKSLKLSYNLYTKTDTKNHKIVVQQLFLDLLKNGYIKKGVMKQYYSSKDKQFLPDRYVEGTCPYCSATGQRSDQCENCGRWIEDGALVLPVSKLSGAKVELKDTEHYFLDFESLNKSLLEYVSSKNEIWRQWVFNESKGWLNEGLKKRAITRDLDWGISLPVEEIKKLSPSLQLKDFIGKKIYVWFEAVIGYLSASIEWSSTHKSKQDILFKRYKGQELNWEEWWFNKSAKHYYFLGQDNLVFHTLMWPAQLIGTKKNYTLPENVVVNKFMNYQGKKFSKSRNWIIDSKEIIDEFGLDPVRYYIFTNLPEYKQGNFTWETFIDSINNELVANLGNLINRTLSFFKSRYQGEIFIQDYSWNKLIEVSTKKAFQESEECFENCKFNEAISVVMAYAKEGNKYFDNTAIWKEFKDDPKQAELIMLDLLNVLANIAILIRPFLPDSAKKLSNMLGIEVDKIEVGINLWKHKIFNTFKLGSEIEMLFKKIDKVEVLANKTK